MSQLDLAARTALDALERYRASIQAELRVALERGEGPPYSLMRYHLGWQDASGHPVDSRGGKLLRPALLLLCCEASGGDVEQALPAAAAVELLHNFTLLHDDVEDASETRHGRETAWRVWDKAEAINAGDGMFGLAHLTMLGLAGRAVPADRVLAAARMLDEATLLLCEGQHHDLRYAAQAAIPLSAYLAMIEGKTSALLAASCAIGGLLGGSSEGGVKAFHEFGRRLGLAFQIRDDILGCWGDSSAMGKSRDDDIRTGKRSYPIVVGLERASEDQRAQFRQVLGRTDAAEEELSQIRDLLERLGARAEGETAAREHAEAAIESLRDLSLGDQRAELEALALFAAERPA